MTQTDTSGVAAAVRAIVAVVAPSPPASPELVTSDSRLIADLGFHSLALLELGQAMEELFRMEDGTAQQAELLDRVGELELFLQQAIAQGDAQPPIPAEVETFVRDFFADHGV